MPDTATAPKAVPGAPDRAMQIRQKAKVAAKRAGKEWADLSKDERKTFMDVERDKMKDAADEKRSARQNRAG